MAESGSINAFHHPKGGERDALIIDIMPRDEKTDVAALRSALLGGKMPAGVALSPDVQEEEVAFGLKKLRVQARGGGVTPRRRTKAVATLASAPNTRPRHLHPIPSPRRR